MDNTTLILRDIQGLDGVPWWPLAQGWWYAIGVLCVLLMLVGIRFWLIYHGPWLGWQGDARRKLRALKKVLSTEDPRVVAGRLSELLRRIAMARSGRREAAGLTDEEWLHWLQQHDSSGFAWEKRARVLLTAPYMPPEMTVERKELAALIRAARRWIDTSKPPRQPGNLKKRLRGLLAGTSGRRGPAHV
jgi:hypothetical protein